jgi:hypothetical protein
MNAMAISVGKARRIAVRASRPPADAPIATTGISSDVLLGGGLCTWEVGIRHRSLRGPSCVGTVALIFCWISDAPSVLHHIWVRAARRYPIVISTGGCLRGHVCGEVMRLLFHWNSLLIPIIFTDHTGRARHFRIARDSPGIQKIGFSGAPGVLGECIGDLSLTEIQTQC